MTPLRQRMLEDMQLRGFSARTQECYIAAVRQLADHFRTSPDRLTEEQLREYFLYLANEKKVARATATIALCGIRFFFEQTLRREWTTLRFVRPAREHKLPVVLSREEVRRVLAMVRIPVYRVCLTTIYACGLRLLEGAHLQVADIDSARVVLHTRGDHSRVAVPSRRALRVGSLLLLRGGDRPAGIRPLLAVFVGLASGVSIADSGWPRGCDGHGEGERMNQPARDEAALSPTERSLVAALLSAIVKELRAEKSQPARRPAV
jgi:integrase